MKVAQRVRTRMQVYWKTRGFFMVKIRKTMQRLAGGVIESVAKYKRAAEAIWKSVVGTLRSVWTKVKDAVLKGGTTIAKRRAHHRSQIRGEQYVREVKVVGIQKKRMEHLHKLRAF